MSDFNRVDLLYVHQAITEFDKLGDPAFYDKYGFGESNKYDIIYQDNRYPSKAIMSAAFQIQYPNESTSGILKKGGIAPGNAAYRAIELGLEVINKRTKEVVDLDIAHRGNTDSSRVEDNETPCTSCGLTKNDSLFINDSNVCIDCS